MDQTRSFVPLFSKPAVHWGGCTMVFTAPVAVSFASSCELILGAHPMKTLAKLASVLVVVLCIQCTWSAAQEKKADSTRSKSRSAKSESAKAESQKTETAKSESSKSEWKDPLENMKFRNLGPAVGGGRVTAVVGIPGRPNIYYVGTAGGGVFMTQDGGLSWKPIFEKESTASIGAIALAPSNPNLIWVGTGEKNIRNDLVTGKGVFFSPDAGNTWKFMGLRDAG